MKSTRHSQKIEIEADLSNIKSVVEIKTLYAYAKHPHHLKFMELGRRLSRANLERVSSFVLVDKLKFAQDTVLQRSEEAHLIDIRLLKKFALPYISLHHRILAVADVISTPNSTCYLSSFP